MTAEGGKFLPGQREVETPQIPFEVVEHLLGGNAVFSASVLESVGKRILALTAALTARVLEDKKGRVLSRNASLCIEPIPATDQRHITGLDAAKTLKKLRVFSQHSPDPETILKSPKVPVPFLIQHGSAPHHTAYAAAAVSAQVATPGISVGVPAVNQPAQHHMPPPYGLDIDMPRKRGRGRPPLRPRTDQNFNRVSQSSAPIPDLRF